MSDQEKLTEHGIEELIETLSHLASVHIQDKYIVHGTIKEYLVPDDLLEDFISALQFLRFEKYKNERLRALDVVFGANGIQKITVLENHIKTNPEFLEQYTHETLKALIHKDPIWSKIVLLAQEVLSEINYDLSKWEAEYT